MQTIIEQIKQANLRGRGGAGFPTASKWEMVKNAKAAKKYVVCNAAEGEADLLRGEFILQKFPNELIDGIKIAMEAVGAQEAYIYLRKDLHRKFKPRLINAIGNLSIKVFKKRGGYLAGEETTVLEDIEGERIEPRNKPPYPVEKGLFGCPTLINNIETLYYVAKIARDEYKKTRLYTLAGAIENKGVFEIAEDWTVEKILRETKNWPEFDFFVRVGGGTSGEFITSKELNCAAGGDGSIIVFDRKKTDIKKLLKNIIDVFYSENCGKCVPCREGVYRIHEMVKNGKIDTTALDDILAVLNETTFCPFGKCVVQPLASFYKKFCLKND